ncbi:hypothetical protein [Tsukamurella soli]|uniref:Uncharacterized protein n=1 Tax=Tsukamurella soli TaxID=644556 RepID=A0ABP8J479_9ACTN
MATQTATLPATTESTDDKAIFTTFLSSVVDSTKVLVDDVLADAKKAEKGARKRINDIADADLRKTLKKQTKALNKQVEKLSTIRSGK